MAFGELLKRYRAATGMTQEELAERASVSARAISALERGVNRAPRRDTLELAARRSRSLGAADEAGWGEATVMELAGQWFPTGGFLGSLPSGRLVGRVDELSRILAAVEAAVQGQGRLVLLRGEAGIGKTRLAQETTLQLRDLEREGIVEAVSLGRLSREGRAALIDDSLGTKSVSEEFTALVHQWISFYRALRGRTSSSAMWRRPRPKPWVQLSGRDRVTSRFP
jgi:transcriptional regulator with XRE-family HTH domain